MEEYLQWIKKELSDIGYKPHLQVLNAEYGVPQLRERAFFIGTKYNSPFRFPAPTHGIMTELNYKTVKDAIWDLIDLGPDEIPNPLL